MVKNRIFFLVLFLNIERYRMSGGKSLEDRREPFWDPFFLLNKIVIRKQAGENNKRQPHQNINNILSSVICIYCILYTCLTQVNKYGSLFVYIEHYRNEYKILTLCKKYDVTQQLTQKWIKKKIVGTTKKFFLQNCGRKTLQVKKYYVGNRNPKRSLEMLSGRNV